MLTGYRDFLDQAGWEFVGLGDARYSIENHTREVTNAIQRKPDVLVTSLENAQAIGPLLLDARKQGIKVMIGDQTSLDWGHQNDVASHSEDSLRWGEAMGYEAGKQAVKLGKKEGVFIMGNGNPGAALIEARIKGGQNGIAKFNQENSTNFTTDVFPDKAFDDLTESVGKYAAKYDTVRDTCVGALGIAGPNNSAFAKMMKDKGIKPGSLVVGGGHDGQPEVAAMQDGYIQYFFVRNTYGMGYIAAAQAWQWVERGFKPADYLVSFELTYPEGLEALKARDAVWTGKAKEYGYRKQGRGKACRNARGLPEYPSGSLRSLWLDTRAAAPGG